MCQTSDAHVRGKERRCILESLWLLAELQRRDVHLILGYSSLFTYCRQVLLLTKSSAFRRTVGAFLIGRYPDAAEYLLDGRLSLTKFVSLRKVLTAENHLELIEQASSLTEDEVDVLVATLRPRRETRDTIRKLPSREEPAPERDRDAESHTSAFAGGTLDVLVAEAPSSPAAASGTGFLASAPPAERPPRIQPINAERYSLTIHVGREFMEELRRVKAALSHKVPDGNLEGVLRLCMQQTIASCDKLRFGGPCPPDRSPAKKSPTMPPAADPAPGSVTEPGACQTPGPDTREGSVTEPSARQTPAAEAGAASGSLLAGDVPMWSQRTGYIPVAERRAVGQRDEGSCAWVGPDGKRCGSTHQLEFAHVIARAWGGDKSRTNVRLLCRAHNQYEARRDFGAEFMSQFSRGARNRPDR